MEIRDNSLKVQGLEFMSTLDFLYLSDDDIL